MGEDKLRERQRAFREQEIALVTARLLAKTDCGSLTMDQVAEALGTSKASIYRLFNRETLLRRSVQDSVEDLAGRAQAAATKAAPAQALRAAAKVLVEGWLRLATRPDGFRAPCCLKEVECPFADWNSADRTLRELAAASEDRNELGHRDVRLARALRALAAVRMYQVRASGRTPTKADIDAVLRHLLPDPPKVPSRHRKRRP